MNHKSAQKHLSFGFIGIPVLVMIVLAITLVATAKSIYDKSHVLGQSTMLAEDTGGGSPGGNPPPQNQTQQQPQQQSQPQQQQSQPQQNQQPPQQNNQPSQQGSQPQQPNQQNSQQGNMQQMNPQNYQPTGGQNGSYGQNNQYNQSGNNQGSQQNPQTGNYNIQGQGGGQNQQGSGNSNQQGSNNNQSLSAQDQQRYQQMQQQWQQQAAQAGFQLSGSLPTQYFQQSQQNNQQGTGSNNSLPSLSSFPSINGAFNVSSSTGGQSVNLNDGNTKVQLGSSNLTAVKSDGSKVSIDKSALDKITTAIKLETGSEVAQTGDTFSLKRGQVQANTKFPIAFNVATKTFTVQTQNGEQEVKVLPDQAVQKLLENKETSSTSSTVILTELNNQPVYQVQGTSQKRFLGILPVSIAKITYVSAQTGESVKTDTSALSKILDTISF